MKTIIMGEPAGFRKYIENIASEVDGKLKDLASYVDALGAKLPREQRNYDLLRVALQLLSILSLIASLIGLVNTCVEFGSHSASSKDMIVSATSGAASVAVIIVALWLSNGQYARRIMALVSIREEVEKVRAEFYEEWLSILSEDEQPSQKRMTDFFKRLCEATGAVCQKAHSAGVTPKDAM